MTALRKITLVRDVPMFHWIGYLDLLPDYVDVPDTIDTQEYYDPEYDMNEGCMSDNGYWDTEDPESDDDLWYAAGCPTDEDISEFFARQRCD